jgi:hypothetical protein
VGGIDFDVIRQREQPAQRGVELPARFGSAEVGAADVADEERVAAEHQPRFGGAGAVGDQQRDAFRRVPRGVQRAHDHVAERDLAAVVERRERERHLGRAVKIERRTAASGELTLTGAVVGANVGRDDSVIELISPPLW